MPLPPSCHPFVVHLTPPCRVFATPLPCPCRPLGVPVLSSSYVLATHLRSSCHALALISPCSCQDNLCDFICLQEVSDKWFEVVREALRGYSLTACPHSRVVLGYLRDKFKQIGGVQSHRLTGETVTEEHDFRRALQAGIALPDLRQALASLGLPSCCPLVVSLP